MSRFIAFDPGTKKFDAGLTGLFHAVNLSALSPSLIESELFGHVKGSFTDAVSDRMGRLQLCGKWGAVFLDEIGELDPAMQVKLLRVLQTRDFQRVGDNVDLRFGGKSIAATNRDLAEAMRAGFFREDLYYRLCSDVIVTPSLHEQLQESPDVLQEFLRFIARKVAEPIADALAEQAEAWILEHLGLDYHWPGNFREMEQCVRSILIRKQYHPTQSRRLPAHDEFMKGVSDGSLTADELLSRYCTLVYSQTGSYQETARRVQLDRRTVKAKVDPEFLSCLA
jgi:transcriptional regulator with GAF, ATPase, and Fis domain